MPGDEISSRYEPSIGSATSKTGDTGREPDDNRGWQVLARPARRRAPPAPARLSVEVPRQKPRIQSCSIRLPCSSQSRLASGNKKERVPGGPLSKPFGSSDRYEVSNDGQYKYSVLPIRCKGKARGPR